MNKELTGKLKHLDRIEYYTKLNYIETKKPKLDLVWVFIFIGLIYIITILFGIYSLLNPYVDIYYAFYFISGSLKLLSISVLFYLIRCVLLWKSYQNLINKLNTEFFKIVINK